MNVISTCWYLSGLFLVMLVLSNLVTVTPDGEAVLIKIMGTLLGLTFTSLASAIVLMKKRKGNPDSWTFTSQTLKIACLLITTTLTLILVFGVVG